MDPIERFDLQCELANFLNRDVDLIDLARASEVMRAEILREGVVAFALDDEQRAAYEMLPKCGGGKASLKS